MFNIEDTRAKNPCSGFYFIIFKQVFLNLPWSVLLFEAGTTFDNSFFDNSFGFLRQFKNGSFLDPVFVHVTG